MSEPSPGSFTRSERPCGILTRSPPRLTLPRARSHDPLRTRSQARLGIAGRPRRADADAGTRTAPTTPPRRSRTRGLVRPAILATALIATFGVGVGVGRVDLAPADGAAATPGASFEPGEEFALIREAWDKIHQNYVAADELDDRELAYGAIDGLADAVGDTGHTEFMTPRNVPPGGRACQARTSASAPRSTRPMTACR